MSTSLQLDRASNAEAFAAWARVYDEQENPLLLLEKRILSRMLPDARNKSVIDLGCGTGRWLSYFSHAGAATVCGLDSSRAMLDVAAAKNIDKAELIHSELPFLPLASRSIDLALASFVLSYVDDLTESAAELARVLRPGGDLFISDMNPETAIALGWRRSFSTAGQRFELAVKNRRMGEVIDAFASRGFSLVASLEPHFGGPERALFQKHKMESAWIAADGLPPIYMLQLRRSPVPENEGDLVALCGARCALGPRESLSAAVTLQGDVIASLLSETPASSSRAEVAIHDLDLTGYLLFPGLVNAHDHLEFALFPRLGHAPYADSAQWAEDIHTHQAESIQLHKTVPKETRLWWGGVRNLLCGVTTVCHHNPLHPFLQGRDFPVRVVQEYSWAHSLTFAREIPKSLRRTGPDEPFVIHAGEGIDQNSVDEFDALDALGALESRSVLVHGLALDRAGTERLNERGCSLVVCPSSNHFLFQRTHTRELLESVARLALGSDSPLTADGDLLDELRFTHRRDLLAIDRLYGTVTDKASGILRLHNGEGTLRIGASADLFAVRHRDGDPSEILACLSWRDVELVIVGGQVRLASPEIWTRLPPALRCHLTAIKVDDHLRWLHGPVLEYLDSAESVLGSQQVRVGGRLITREEI